MLGQTEAAKRLQGIERLIQRPDVTYVSVKVSSVVAQLSMWSYDQTVERVVDTLVPLYEKAATTTPPTFINLDMEEYRDLEMTLDVFQRVLDRDSLRHYYAGIVLQAYLPEALGAMKRLSAFAIKRVEAGGAQMKVRVVKGANLQMEQVDAALHDWPVAVLPSKQDSDTNYKRVLEWALTPKRAKAIRIGVAGHNLFDVAFAHLLAERRGVYEHIDFEMLVGMAPDQADAVRETVGSLILYTPVVHSHEFDAAVGYLVRRLDENASPENFMSAVFDLHDHDDIFRREENRFRDSLAALTAKAPASQRTQDRTAESLPRSVPSPETFHKTSPTLTCRCLPIKNGHAEFTAMPNHRPVSRPAWQPSRQGRFPTPSVPLMAASRSTRLSSGCAWRARNGPRRVLRLGPRFC